MNRQNFKNENQSYPISTDTLDFMQGCTNLVAKLAGMAGDNYILKQSSAITDGTVVIDGEIMPLIGSPDLYIEIVENRESITAFDVVYSDARIIRHAEYKSVSTAGILTNTVPLLDGARLLQLKESVNLLLQSLNQVSDSLGQVSNSLGNLSNQVQNNYAELSAHRVLLAGTVTTIILDNASSSIIDINFPSIIPEEYLFFGSIRGNMSNMSPAETTSLRVIVKYNNRVRLQLCRNHSMTTISGITTESKYCWMTIKT